MRSNPELLTGHITLEVECPDRLYLNGYIGPLATNSRGVASFMRVRLGQPIPSPVVLGQAIHDHQRTFFRGWWQANVRSFSSSGNDGLFLGSFLLKK
jgi:hypothetical protein